MIDEELLNKFSRIQDLPVSEEMLGAYIEDKLDYAEREFIQQEINSDLSLINLSHSITEDIESELNFDTPLIDSIELPLFIDEFQIQEDQQMEYLPSTETIDIIDSFDLPDVAEEYSDDLDDDLTNE